MKAVKKAVVIEVVEFDPHDIVPVGAMLQVDPDDGSWRVFNELHTSWIGVKPGDYLNVTSLADVYPIDRAYFESHYDVVT